MRIDCYICPNKHLTFTRAPENTGWAVSNFITCPKCRHRSISCREPPGIQGQPELATLEWFIPITLTDYRNALWEASTTSHTIGQARRLFESLTLHKKMFYRKIKN